MLYVNKIQYTPYIQDGGRVDRVIVRAPYVGLSVLGSSQYRQTIGRAGRAGIDTSGESILIVQPKDRSKVGLISFRVHNKHTRSENVLCSWNCLFLLYVCIEFRVYYWCLTMVISTSILSDVLRVVFSNGDVHETGYPGCVEDEAGFEVLFSG